MQQIKYADLHCDSLTASFKLNGGLYDERLQAPAQRLKNGGCILQCYAIFTRNENLNGFIKYADYYALQLKEHGRRLASVQNFCDLEKTERQNKLGCLLTVENLGFLGCNLLYINELAARGVKMASLVWNEENCLAYPNVIVNNGTPQIYGRDKRGLKPLGRQVVELLDENKIMIDLSHLSDGGAEEILNGRKIPVVASHSNAAEVCGVSRNLTDSLIKKIADCGGVIGVNFYKNFIGEGDIFSGVLRHLKHFINVGGENLICFGSDFDGIPPSEGLENCKKVQSLINYLNLKGIKGEVLDKLLYKNFFRVFKEVCG